MNDRNQRWEDKHKRKEAFEEELRNTKIKRNEELFYRQAARWEEEEMNYCNQRRENERKRRETFEEELKSAKKLKNEKRQINENLMKNKENTEGNEKQINENIKNDHSNKDSAEPLQEDMDKDTQEQNINNNKREEEIISTEPMIEPITENDYNESCEPSNEHSETMNKTIENPHMKINNNDDITGVNNKDTQEIINDNKPIIIIEHAIKNPEPLDGELKETSNTETPEVDNTADNTIENQLEQMEELQQQEGRT